MVGRLDERGVGRLGSGTASPFYPLTMACDFTGYLHRDINHIFYHSTIGYYHNDLKCYVEMFLYIVVYGSNNDKSYLAPDLSQLKSLSLIHPFDNFTDSLTTFQKEGCHFWHHF